MLRQQELCRVSMLRWSPVQSADEMPPYDLVCTLVWRSPTEFWIEGMRGEVRPEYIREWADWLREHGITKVYAHRAPGHRLPLFRDVGEHLELSVDS
jgi:hypothetical protein